MSFWSELWENMRTYVTDWYSSDVLDEHLEQQALKQRKPVSSTFFAKTSQQNQQDYSKNLPKKASDGEKFDSFMFSGVDYRGQAQYAYETLGYGASISASVDPVKMFAPPGVSMFVTTNISASFSIKQAHHRFIYVAHQGEYKEVYQQPVAPQLQLQPSKQLDFKEYMRQRKTYTDRMDQHNSKQQAWTPIVMSCMLGRWTNTKAGLGIEVGAKFDTTNLLNIDIAEIESFSFSMKLTASANTSIEGTWVLVTDSQPAFIEKSRVAMQKWFTEHLPPSSVKESLKEQFVTVNPDCYLSWFLQTKDAGAALNAGIGVGTAFKTGSYEGQTIGPGMDLGLAIKLPSVKWMAKTSSYRLNTPCSNQDLVWSQETKILYKQIGGQIFGLALDLQLGIAAFKPNPLTGGETETHNLTNPFNIFVPQSTQNVQASPKVFSSYTDYKDHGGKGTTKITETPTLPNLDIYESKNFKLALTASSLKVELFEDKLKKVEKKWQLVNSMSYESGFLLWSKSNRQLLEGCGLVIGQSLTLASFIKYWSNREQCSKLMPSKSAIPEMQEIKPMIEAAINKILPASESVIPITETWLASTETQDWRRSIKAVDSAVTAYNKHLHALPWTEHDVFNQLMIKVRQKITQKTNESQQDLEKRQYGQLLQQCLQEVKARGKLYKTMLTAIEKWYESKGGKQQAESNPRYPAVIALEVKCLYHLELLDGFASGMEVFLEYLEMRKLEKGLADFFHLSVEKIQQFLADKGVQGAIVDLTQLQAEQAAMVPGAFLIEAYFKLNTGSRNNLLRKVGKTGRFKTTNNDVENDFTDDIKKQFHDNFEDNLQCICIRYRLADTKRSDRSFKLGVNVGAASLGITLDRVRQAGTEGSFMVNTVWFGSYTAANDHGGWPEGTVPMPLLLS